MNRRKFLESAGKAGLGLTLLSEVMAKRQSTPRLTLLHTNDTHSRIDPFPMDGGKLAGLGGVARRKVLIDQIRAREEFVLTLDSGDIFQGTPYYNLYGGEVEIKAMNEMGYEVCTLGNHEFDNGVEGLEKVLPFSEFEWVSSNLDCAASGIASWVKPWTIKQVGPFRVGVFGLICRLEGMVSPRNHEGVVYLDPVESARGSVSELKARGCNLIVCLSHMGYKSRRGKEELRDDRLVEEVEGIDLVLGGHSHTFIDELDLRPRKGGGLTGITQQGWGGLRLGRVDVGLQAGGLAMTQSPVAIA